MCCDRAEQDDLRGIGQPPCVYRIKVRLCRMAKDRPGPGGDRLLVARLTGVAKRHAHWREPTEAETVAAVAELRTIADGRADLLAEVAGILLGASEGELEEPRSRAAAQLLLAAGADEALMPQWIEEGRRRARAARLPPFSRPRRRKT